MSEQQSSYRQIMKATSIFGGVQVFQIVIQIIRSKFVALFLGPAGMGIMGLLTSTIGLITNLTNFGLSTSAVKNIAEANGSGDENKIAVTTKILRRLVWGTGLLGTIITLVLAPWLSQFTFGNKNYTLAFVIISITLLFTQLNAGQLVVMQGLRKLQYLAKSNVWGSVIGLIIIIPMYYFWGVDGIVPVIVCLSLSSLLLSTYFAKKIKVQNVQLTYLETFHKGYGMLKMGFVINLSGLLSVGASYLIRIFINKVGNVSDVGLYSAGFAIINTYVAMIFNAMGTDYYPRLSAVSNDNQQCRKTINQQAEIAILILAPILIIFLVFIKWIIILLYSSKFAGVSGLIYWSAIGMFFKSASWCIAFLFMAKGNSKLFFWSELISNIYVLIFNIIGYYFMGLTGLGISFAAGYIVYLIQVYVLSQRYIFKFEIEYLKIFFFQVLLAIIAFGSIYIIPNPYFYILGVIIVAISLWYSYVELNSRIGLRQIIVDNVNKYRNK